MHKLAALMVVVAACGDGGGTPDALVLLDSSIDAGIPPGPNLVELRASGAQYVVYRDGNGPWLVPEQASVGNYNLYVTDEFQVLTGCSNATTSEASLSGRTFDDGERMFAFCGAGTSNPPTTVQVTGSMTEAGEVWMDDSQTSTTAPWNFTLDVQTGAHDLIARSANNRMVIRRNVSITGATAIPAIDAVATGTAMTPLPLTITGMLGSETLQTDVDLLLANDFAILKGSSTTLQTPPASLLGTNDFMLLLLDLTTATTSRSASTFFTGSEDTFVLMPVISGISYQMTSGVLAASWGTMPGFTELQLDLFGTSNARDRRQSVSATSSWLAKTSTTRLAFDVAPPGFDATWNVDIAGPYTRMFSAANDAGAIFYSSRLSEPVNGAVARPAPQRMQPRARVEAFLARK